MTGEAKPIVPTLSRDKPFRGMLSYQDSKADEQLFVGRSAEGSTLVDTIKGNVLTVFYGHSGTGKTSLLNAYAIPALRRVGYLPIYIKLDYGVTTPKSLTDQVKEIIQSDPAWKENHRKSESKNAYNIEFTFDGHTFCTETLWEYFTRYSSTKGTAVPILIFDAFEEIFTLGSDVKARVDALIQELHYLIENQFPELSEAKIEREPDLLTTRTQKFRVLIAIREDYLPQLNRLKNSIYSIDKSKVGLDDITIETAGDIIRTIQEKFRVKYFDDNGITLIKQYLKSDDATGKQKRKDPVSITLGLICYQVNQHRINTRKATLFNTKDNKANDVEETIDMVTSETPMKEDIVDSRWLTPKSIEKLIGEYYTTSVKDRSVRRIIEDQLINKDGYRIPIPEKLLLKKGLTADIIKDLVDDKRILRYERRLGNADVEIVHDSLAKKIWEQRKDREEQKKVFTGAALIALGLAIVISAFVYANVQAIKADKEVEDAKATAKFKIDSAILVAGESTRKAIEDAEAIVSQRTDANNQLLAEMKAQTESEIKKRDRDHEARLEEIEQTRQREADVAALEEKQTQLKIDLQLNNIRRLTFARSMAENAIQSGATRTGRTEALLAYDTLLRPPHPMKDDAFPEVYEALVTTTIDSLRTPAYKLAPGYGPFTGGRILKGNSDDYYYSISDFIPQKRSVRSKMAPSDYVRTWIGPDREQKVYLGRKSPEKRSNETRYRIVLGGSNITVPLGENENVESLLFLNNETVLLVSTRVYNKPGKVFWMMVDNGVRTEIDVALDTDEFIMLDNVDNMNAVGFTNKGRYMKAATVNAKAVTLSAKVPSFNARVTCMSWSDDKRLVLVGLENGRAYEFSDGRPPELILAHPDEARATSIASSEDGRWTAVGFNRGGVILRDNSRPMKRAQIAVNLATTTYSSSVSYAVTSLLFVDKDQSLAIAREDAIFYHIPLSSDALRAMMCEDKSLIIDDEEWYRAIRTIKPRDLCKPIE